MKYIITDKDIIEPFSYVDKDEYLVFRNNNHKVRCENCVDLTLGRCTNIYGNPTIKSIETMGCYNGYDIRRKMKSCKYYNPISGFCYKKGSYLVFYDVCKKCKHQKARLYNKKNFLSVFKNIFDKFIIFFRR